MRTQHRYEAGVDQHGGRQASASLLHLVDDAGPPGGEFEIGRPLRQKVRDDHVDRFRPRFVYVSSTLRRETMAGPRTSTSPGGYAEFRIGDYQHELGLIDSSYAPHDTTGGPAGVVCTGTSMTLPQRSSG